MNFLQKEAFDIYGTKSPAKHQVIERMRASMTEEEFQGATKMMAEFEKFYILPCGHQAGDWIKVNFGPGMSSDNAKIVKVHLAGFTTTYDIEVEFDYYPGGVKVGKAEEIYKVRLHNVPSAFISRKDKPSDFKDHIIVYPEN